MLRGIWAHFSRAFELFVYVIIGVFIAALARAETPRVLTIGDSLMAFHSTTGRSVPHYLERALGIEVMNLSVVGARMIYQLPLSGALGLSIPMQFRKGYDWVVMNGGGNDLWLGCGCGKRCVTRMDRLIAQDGTRGAIPRLMAKFIEDGTQVIYVGYLRSPGLNTPIEHCKDDGDELERRVANLAARIEGIHYVSLQDLVPPGDRSFFTFDLIHPSAKASKQIAARIADVIR